MGRIRSGDHKILWIGILLSFFIPTGKTTTNNKLVRSFKHEQKFTKDKWVWRNYVLRW